MGRAVAKGGPRGRLGAAYATERLRSVASTLGVERSFAWICYNRRMSLWTMSGSVRVAKRWCTLP
jgi:hypothetical protein